MKPISSSMLTTKHFPHILCLLFVGLAVGCVTADCRGGVEPPETFFIVSHRRRVGCLDRRARVRLPFIYTDLVLSEDGRGFGIDETNAVWRINIVAGSRSRLPDECKLSELLRKERTTRGSYLQEPQSTQHEFPLVVHDLGGYYSYYFGEDGALAFEGNFGFGTPFLNQRAFVKVLDEDGNIRQLNGNGRFVGTNRYSSVGARTQEVFIFGSPDGYGLADRNDNILLPATNRYLAWPGEGMIKCNWRTTDYHGTLQFSDDLRVVTIVRSFSEGLAPAAVYYRLPNGKWSSPEMNVVDRHGVSVFKSDYEDMGVYSEGLSPMANGDKWGFLDRTGNVVVPCRYAWVSGFRNGFARGRLENEYEETIGYDVLDRSGKIVWKESLFEDILSEQEVISLRSLKDLESE